jgi:hypothetical protein
VAGCCVEVIVGSVVVFFLGVFVGELGGGIGVKIREGNKVFAILPDGVPPPSIPRGGVETPRDERAIWS